MTLLVIKGSSHNDVMTIMSQQLCDAFNAVGFPARAVAAKPADVASVMEAEVARGDVNGVFSFAAFGADLTGAGGRSLYEPMRHGFIGWNVDHPSYQFERMTARLPRRHTLCASEDHFQFIELMGGRGRKLLMLPGTLAAPVPKAWADRGMPVLVAMSWMGLPDRWWAGVEGTPVGRLMEGMLERLAADPTLDLGKAYRPAAQAAGIHVPFNADLSNLVCKLLTYVRQIDRLNLVRGLQAAGIPFTLCGDGWEGVLGGDPRVTLRPSTDFAGLNALYGDCQVVLNLNAANGASERAISAMGAGAAVVSDWGALLAESFGEQIAFYDRTDVAGTVGVIGDLLESGRGEAMATAAHRTVTASHLWTHKAQAITNAVRAAWP